MRRTRVRVVYENKDITREIVEDVISVSLTDNLSRADDMSISMKDPTLKWMGGWMPEKGDRISIELHGENWEMEGDIQKISFGPFCIDSLSHKGSPQTVGIGGVSFGLESNLKGERKNRAWENINLKAIAEEIAKGAGAKLYFDSDYNPSYKRVEQNEEGDLSLLKRLCGNECMEIKVENNQIIIFDERKYEGLESIMTIPHTPSLDFSITNDDADSYDKCVVTYFDNKNKKKITGEYTAPPREGYSTGTGRVLRIKGNDGIQGETYEEIQGELVRRARNMLRQANKRSIRASISNMKGDFKLYSGAMVTLEGFGKYNGRYMVKRVRRSVGSKYSMSIELQREVRY